MIPASAFGVTLFARAALDVAAACVVVVLPAELLDAVGDGRVLVSVTPTAAQRFRAPDTAFWSSTPEHAFTKHELTLLM